MKGKFSLLVAAMTFGIFFAAASLYAASTTVPDVVKMDNPAYEKHTKPIVTFTHKKHATEYATANPDLFKNGCGTCHHDKDNKPLTNLKEGDEVHDCIECHKIPGKAPLKNEDGSKLTDKEKLEYHAEAMHDNCKECHKEYDKASGTKDAPTTCNKCHVKEEG